MRGCVIAGVILVLVLAAVVLNSFYVRRTVDILAKAAEALPEIPDPVQTPLEIARIGEMLETQEAFLEITVSSNTIVRVAEALTAMEAAARAENLTQYVGIRAVLVGLIRDIGRSEKLSMDNIL